MSRTVSTRVLLVALMGIVTARAAAVGPGLWVQAGEEDFAAGVLESVAVTSDGQVQLAPLIERLYDVSNPHVWAMEVAPDGAVYLAVGDEGRVFRMVAGAEPEVFFASQQLAAQAMAWGPDDQLHVATGPRGAVFRLPENYAGESVTPWFVPETTYVWDMVFAPNGDLIVATGEDGAIVRVNREGQGSVLYDSPEAHVTALAVASDGTIYAGTEGNAYVYRIGADGDVFVLFDAPYQEITGLVSAREGLYVGAFGPEQPATADNGGPGEDARPAPGAAAGQPRAGKGAVYLVEADGYARELWSSEANGVLSLAPAPGGGVLVGTGSEGALVRVDAAGNRTMLGELDAAQIVAMAAASDTEVYLATSNIGRVYRLRRRFRDSGTFLSSIKDTETTSRWGTVRWRASMPPGTSLAVYSRSGNTAEADDTWSDWAGPYDDPEGSAVASPPARYLQWKAVLETGDDARSPALERVEIVYVPRNLPPRVTKLQVHPPGVVYRQTTSFEDGMPFAQLPSAVAEAMRELERGDTAQITGGRAFLGRPFYIAGLRTLSWEATDPNGDDLRYSLSFRAEDETVWKPLENDLADTVYVFDTARVPDGGYRVRLTVSDAASNAAEEKLEAHRASAAFVVDNTPPIVSDLGAVEDAGTVVVTARTHDATTLIRQAEYSVDGGAWHTVLPADGVVDSASETLSIRLTGLDAGEHVVVVRATDTALNRGAGKVVFVID